MSRTNEIILREIIVATALGGIPVAVTFATSGETEMLRRLTTLKPSDDVFLYFAALLALHGVVYLLNRWWLKPNDSISAAANFAHNITEQIGFGIHGIYRAVTGAVPMALGLLIYQHGLTGAASAIAFSVILVVGGLFMCWALSLLNENTKRRRSFV